MLGKNQTVYISGYRKNKIYNFEQFERFKTKNTKGFSEHISSCCVCVSVKQ